MGRLSTRVGMGLVGTGTLAVYTAGALGGLLLWQWLFANPPGLLTTVVAVVTGVLVAGYLGYRTGTIRLIASLDASRLPPERAPTVYRRLERLCGQMHVRQPPILVADLDAPNALSIGGPRRGVVVLDRTLLGRCSVWGRWRSCGTRARRSSRQTAGRPR